MVLQRDEDVVLARQRARQIAELLAFPPQDQIRIATAVSEIARNAFRYAGGGRVEFLVQTVPVPLLRVRIADRGPGIADLPAVLEGRYRSTTGMGAGIQGARRLMDDFEITSAPGRGTEVALAKRLPAGAPPAGPELAARLSSALARAGEQDPFEELHLQNQELLRTLEELRARQQELLQLNRELEDTNRGVVALYAELDERVEQLRRSSALRRQFTSYLSHEFRTPLDSIIALSGLLINRVDGELTPEQEKQVELVRRSARDLLSMVDDLLDTARVEAGQVVVRPERFTAVGLFNALRATLRPLLSGDSPVALVFEEPGALPPLHTDEAKLSQILRNFISNALKFTERGTIRVSAGPAEDEGWVRFSVSDTGVGIAPEDQGWIFEDFARVEGAVQRRAKGTGLGLPLSRKLARLLGGEVTVESAPGRGSTFSVVIPRSYPGEQGEDSPGRTTPGAGLP